MSEKANVLLVGGGSVGAMTAYNLEVGGKATIIAVLRSNYDTVNKNGFTINSIQHGFVHGWKPTKVLHAIPRAEHWPPFDFIVVTTKNIPDVYPTVAELISPAVTVNHTAIVLIQNGINIEKPIIAQFPGNPIISGVSLIAATRIEADHVIHNGEDRLIVGEFGNASLSREKNALAAKQFVELYQASGRVESYYDQNVGYVRWRKLVWNACYNSVCAITRVDSGRMRLYQFPVDILIRPLMQEIMAIAKAAGHPLPDTLVEEMINAGFIDNHFKPSMQQDTEKGNFTEFENVVGEPLRVAERFGVPAPYLKVAYGILKVMQQKTKEDNGLIDLPFGPPSPLTPAEDEFDSEAVKHQLPNEL